MSYKCHKCGQEGVKLWRPINDDTLYCVLCACKKEYIGNRFLPNGKLISFNEVDDKGLSRSPLYEDHHMPTDQLNDLLPACPSPNSFWCYTCVPEEDYERWQNLPTHFLTESL